MEPARVNIAKSFDFRYYSGENKAPVLTIFIGGNHEASNYLQELPHGGWVAPNIFYLGYAGVVTINGIRIGGLSGIYKGFDFYKGHFEYPPYDESTKRSVYHYRQQEVFRLKQLSDRVDIMMSHDWPREVYYHGNSAQLCRFKPHFREEIEDNRLGSPPCLELLKQLKPTYWFSGHLHCKFAAVIPHDDNKSTKFLALDKCLPKRKFLQILDIETSEDVTNNELCYDLEWLTILHITKHLTSVKALSSYMPGPGNSNIRWNFAPTDEEKEFVLKRFDNNLKIPLNFEPTAAAFDPSNSNRNASQPQPTSNPQTTLLCDLLDIDDPMNLVLTMSGKELSDPSFIDNLNKTGNADLEAAQGSGGEENAPSEDLDSSYSSTAAVANGMTPLKKRLSLLSTLPPPKNESVSDIPLEEINIRAGQSEESSETAIEAADVDLSNTTSDINETLSSVHTSFSELDTNQCLSPDKRPSTEGDDEPASAVKKFKRRNASIYNAENED